jgi:sugar phosphate isomerase/epimerase
MTYTRRELGKLMLTLPVAGLLPREGFGNFQAKPNSKWAGVQVGMNVPYNYGVSTNDHSRTMPVDDVIAKTVQLAVSAVELRAQPIELFLGVPLEVLEPTREADAQKRAEKQKAAVEALRAWRLKNDPTKASAVRKKFEDAGIKIDIVKFDNIYNFTDPEMDYAFALAKAAGARAISCELDVAGAKRVGQFADKHNLMVGYHGHTHTTEAMFKEAFAAAKHNGANLDIGHYIAGNLGDPVDFIKRYHDRITHIHVKDRKKQKADGADGENVPFGQGDTPIKAVLQVIRDNKWPIDAIIEWEYAVPAGSERMAEMAKCVQYCKDALLT